VPSGRRITPAVKKNAVRRFKEVMESLGLGGDAKKGVEAALPTRLPTPRQVKLFGKTFTAPSKAEQRAQKVVDDELWKRLEDYLIQDLFRLSKDPEGVLVGAKLLTQLAGGKYGPAILKEGLGLQVYNRLAELGGVLFRQQQGTARGGIGTMFVLLAQPGAARGLVEGKIGNFLAIIGAPGVFSRFITSDYGFKFLTRSLKVPLGTPEAAAMLANMNSVSQSLEQFVVDFFSGKLEDRTVEIQ